MVTTTADIGRPPAPTIRVTMLIKVTGTRNGVDWPDIGEDIELPADEAYALIRGNNAKPAPEPVERAIEDDAAPEAAVVRPTTKRRR